MMELLKEGTTSRSAIEIAIAQERLGADISTGTRTDVDSVAMSALTANLTPSLALMAVVTGRLAVVALVDGTAVATAAACAGLVALRPRTNPTWLIGLGVAVGLVAELLAP